MLQPGDRISHYTVESRLGAGGMGEVYLARDERLHRRVALKVILDDGLATPSSGASKGAQDAAARLLREARAAASLTHPNVVSVFDVGEHEGRVFLAMEYVVGKTLREMMVQQAAPWPKRLRWLTDVARALGAAHRAGLVHRDIKPENVMVREDGIVKVLDFGIARRTGGASVDPTGRTEAASVSTLTAEGVVIGTVMYMAPEQIKAGAADARTDQFAWGVMAHELLGGARPWPDRPDLLAIVATILTEPPASLVERAPDLPPVVGAVVARAIDRDPTQRFDSMDELADALDPLLVATSTRDLAGGDRMSRPPGPAGETKPARVVSSQTAPGATSVTRPSPLSPEAATHAAGKRHLLAGAAALAALIVVGSAYRWLHRPLPPRPPKLPPVAVDAGLTGPDAVVGDVAPEAREAYAEGLRLWRDGAEVRCRSSFERAIAADARIAPAHLMLALPSMKVAPAAAQEHFQKAFSHRDRLSPSELRILEAIGPMMRPVADVGESEAKLEEAVKALPNEPMFHFLLGVVHKARSDYEGARAALKDAVRLDPSLMPAWRTAGDVSLALGDPDAAMSAYDSCVQRSPAATICLEQRIGLLRDRGECERLESDARAWISVEPEAPTAHYWLAEALLSRGAPIPSVEAAIKRQWDAMAKDARVASEAEDRANLAIFRGDFAAAEKATAEWEAALARPEVMAHARPQHQLALIAFEIGDTARAGKVADDFLKVMPALTPDPLGGDPSMWFNEYLYRSGRITKDALASRRTAWLTAQERGKTPKENARLAPFRWAAIYAGFAESLDEAKEALAVQADFLPLPPDSRRTMLFNAAYGKALALGGKADDAIPMLEVVTRACVGLDMPELQTRSFYFLGLAEEAKGDLPAAKQAYQVVVDRWGAAKPRSVTAEKARARLKQID